METITLKVDKGDVIRMIKGIAPNYSAMTRAPVKNLGSYTGGFSDTWNWDHSKLENLTIKELLGVYTTCKESW